ncbi:hypothetical protein CJO94_05955 [Ralstonia solanacearum]|nr:hypothetical protein CJO94_05955 [Ralstonia solanacearum]
MSESTVLIERAVGIAPFVAFFVCSAAANRAQIPTICNTVGFRYLHQDVFNPLIWKENLALQILTN